MILSKTASITAPATLCPFSLADGLSRRTERRRRDVDGHQDRGTHRPRFLPEQPLCRGRPVCSREAKVVHGCQTCSLSGVLEPSQLMVPQREIPVAPFHIGAGTLEPLGQHFGLLLELALLRRAQLGAHPTGRTQWGAQVIGQRTKRLASAHRARVGHPLERAGGNERGVHGVGHWRRPVQVTDLPAHIP